MLHPILGCLHCVHTGDLIGCVDAAADGIICGFCAQIGHSNAGVNGFRHHVLEHIHIHGRNHQCAHIASSNGVLHKGDLLRGIALGVLLDIVEALCLHDLTHGVIDHDKTFRAGGRQNGPDLLLAVPLKCSSFFAGSFRRRCTAGSTAGKYCQHHGGSQQNSH